MRLSRAALAALFTFTGTMHFVRPRFFEAIVPPQIEAQKKEIVALSGAAEIAGAALVLHPASRRLGRWWLLALLVAVFPANIHMA
ncbi:MAG TPA: MauE/DoxX family redox-associated membrane protein, partial [Solirubrobacterales bacterium]|nr:MauE/DoxX family redox-associated membrane protein [Solirubrobacterales bacterium]